MPLSKRRTFYGSRATNALLPKKLLLPTFAILAFPFAFLALPFVLVAYGYSAPIAQTEVQKEAHEALAPVGASPQPGLTEQWTTVQAVNPEDILSEEERTEAPEYKDFFEEGGDEPVQLNTGTSAGAIPAVKPFNFGRDPGGPEDKTLYLTIPKLGISEVPVFDSVSEEKLKEGTIHVPATGFPWQGGANVYIAGHRLGYPDTRSLYVFYDLDKLVAGDEIFVKDSAGGEYVYKVTEQKVVPPDNVEVMNAVEDKSLITLQTCTLPDFAERIAVQGELVQKSA
ncbi:MAG: class E sortase [Actinomycetota bacterium]|nr:class E sortase [Actinomycetota bacterium]